MRNQPQIIDGTKEAQEVLEMLKKARSSRTSTVQGILAMTFAVTIGGMIPTTINLVSQRNSLQQQVETLKKEIETLKSKEPKK